MDPLGSTFIHKVLGLQLKNDRHMIWRFVFDLLLVNESWLGIGREWVLREEEIGKVLQN